MIVTFQTATLTHRNRTHSETLPKQSTHNSIRRALGTQQPRVDVTEVTRVFKVNYNVINEPIKYIYKTQ